MYSEEELKVRIGRDVLKNPSLTNKRLNEILYKGISNQASAPIKDLTRRIFLFYAKTVVKFKGKLFIVEELKKEHNIFTKTFLDKKSEKEFKKAFNEEISTRLRILEDEKEEKSVVIELFKFFNKMKKEEPNENKTVFRKELVEWLKNGEATLDLYNKVKEWASDGVCLETFKTIDWPNPSERDFYWRRAIQAVENIDLIDSTEKKILENILTEFFKPLIYKTEENIIEIVGRTIFLSECIAEVKSKLNKNSTVKIFAKDCCNLNTSVKWEGINIIIVTNKINVSKRVSIDVSGNGYQPRKTKAKCSTDIKLSGENGKDGRPGESSGNVTIFAKDCIHPEWLTIIANGGRGEDGQDGGDGCDGEDGIGVGVEEVENIFESQLILVLSNIKIRTFRY